MYYNDSIRRHGGPAEAAGTGGRCDRVNWMPYFKCRTSMEHSKFKTRFKSKAHFGTMEFSVDSRKRSLSEAEGPSNGRIRAARDEIPDSQDDYPESLSGPGNAVLESEIEVLATAPLLGVERCRDPSDAIPDSEDDCKEGTYCEDNSLDDGDYSDGDATDVGSEIGQEDLSLIDDANIVEINTDELVCGLIGSAHRTFSQQLRGTLEYLVEWCQTNNPESSVFGGFLYLMRQLNFDWMLDEYMKGVPQSVQALFEEEFWSFNDLLSLPDVDTSKGGVYLHLFQGQYHGK